MTFKMAVPTGMVRCNGDKGRMLTNYEILKNIDLTPYTGKVNYVFFRTSNKGVITIASFVYKIPIWRECIISFGFSFCSPKDVKDDKFNFSKAKYISRGRLFSPRSRHTCFFGDGTDRNTVLIRYLNGMTHGNFPNWAKRMVFIKKPYHIAELEVGEIH